MSCHFRDIEIDSVMLKKVDHWNVTFWKEGKKVKITMQIPKSGIYEKPPLDRVLSYDACMELAKKIAEILRKELE